jgi:obg-like ATPase 1
MFELCRKDASYVAQVKTKFEADVKRDPKKRPPPAHYALMDRIDEMLNNNIPLRSGDWSLDDVGRINDCIPQAITLKPIVYLINVDKRSFLRKGNKWFAPINEWVKTHGGGTIIPFSVEWEQELWRLRSPPPHHYFI